MTRVKICGLSRPVDIDAVNAEMPDYVGFVFAKSRRQVSPELARGLRERLAPGIIPVGVFADAEQADIAALVRQGVIELVQLHGAEDEDYIHGLKALTGCPVVRAVSVSPAGILPRENAARERVRKLPLDTRAREFADYLLFDSAGGGTGRRFDWDLISGVGAAKPFFLAGGLDADNVREAIARLRPFAVDVSSGVETDGYKDPAKIREFIRRVRHDR